MAEAVRGAVVVLVSCKDRYAGLQPGLRGKVSFVDGGVVYVTWENGQRLGLIAGVDEWTVQMAPTEASDDPEAASAFVLKGAEGWSAEIAKWMEAHGGNDL